MIREAAQNEMFKRQDISDSNIPVVKAQIYIVTVIPKDTNCSL